MDPVPNQDREHSQQLEASQCPLLVNTTPSTPPHYPDIITKDKFFFSLCFSQMYYWDFFKFIYLF